MPAKNSQKLYVKKGYYHLYNRGVEKRNIFENAQDYGVFLSYLKEYLLPKDEVKLREQLTNPATTAYEKGTVLKALRLNNFSEEITLLSYCLMPNHFHLLIHQRSAEAIDGFMNSLATRYTMFFNKKYKRVGPLYQGVYKAVLVQTDEQFLHLSRYIHRNPLPLQGVALQTLSQQSSSYAEYLKTRTSPWVHPETVLSYFSATNPTLSYQNFVEGRDEAPELISDVVIESES